MDTLPKHPPPAGAKVVRLKRRKAVVIAGEDVHWVDDDEAQEAAGVQFRRVLADVQRELQLFPDGPGIDEEERAAFVPYKLRRFVEKTLEPQSLASLCEVSKQSVITALPFALELNPCAGHVVGHRLDAGTDQAVLGKVLKYAVAHELRRNPNPKLKRMLKQGVDAGIRKPRVHRKLHLFGRAERLRRAVHPADVVGRRRQGLSKAAAHVRGE